FAGLKHGLHLREPDEREMAKWRKRGMFKHLDAPLALGPASISCPGKFEPPAEQAGDWSEPLLDDLAQSFICADTTDENDFAPWLEHTHELVESRFGIGDRRDTELRHDDIERVVGERHLLGIHHHEAFDIAQAQAADPCVGFAQHGFGEIYTYELGT